MIPYLHDLDALLLARAFAHLQSCNCLRLFFLDFC